MSTRIERTCASFTALQSIKDVGPKQAHLVRKIWRKMTREQLIEQFPHVADYVRQCHNPPDTRQLRRMAVDHTIGTYGVEYLGTSRRTGEHIEYCNSGDTYDTTILFFGPHLRVGCWGDLVERGSVKTWES
jgi:hypothetical protein